MRWLLLKDLRQRVLRRRQYKPARVAYLVSSRVKASHHAGVRWSRERSLGRGTFEQNSVLCDPVEIGSIDFTVTIASQPVGAQRVDGHENHIHAAERPNTFILLFR